MPALAMACDRIGALQLVVTDQQFASSVVRRRWRPLPQGLDACMLVRRLNDPREDDADSGRSIDQE